jgi:rod shape-determining protein MreD
MMKRSLDEKRLDLTFFFCLALTFAAPSLSPSLRLFFFTPFLIIACYQLLLPSCLWLAFFCGLILDLITANAHLGIHALAFCLTLLLLYPQKRNFFSDSLSTLPIMTFLFASLASLMVTLILYTVEMKHGLSWHWALTDLILMPAADAVYAFCCFILPALLFGKPQRRGKDYFYE